MKLINTYRSWLIFLVIIICSIPSVLPLFHPGFFQSDDGGWMIIRFSAFHQALARGQFPVRYLPRLNYEYGYPVTDFLYPGYLYLAEPFHLIRFNFITSIKIIFGLSLIGSALFCFLWLRSLFTRWASFIGSLVYLYLPYHMYDTYSRGSIGEVLALAVVPFILWGIEQKRMLITIFGIGFLILSHNTLAALFMPCILLYMFLQMRKNLPAFVTQVILGILTATFFWFPALYDLQFTVFSKTTVSDWKNYFASTGLICPLTIAILILAICFLLIHKTSKIQSIVKKSSVQTSYVYLFIIICVISLFLATSISHSVWYLIPSAFIQFPFRLLSVELIAVAFLCAYIMESIKGKMVTLFVGIFVIVWLSYSVIPYFKSITYSYLPDTFYSTNEDTTTVQGEYMPKWVKQLPTQRPTQVVNSSGSSISNLVVSENKIQFTQNTKSSVLTYISLIYFPGWNVTVDGNKVPILNNNQRGLIAFEVPAGNHQILVKFSETWWRLYADLLSVFTILLSFATWLYFRKIKGLPNSKK